MIFELLLLVALGLAAVLVYMARYARQYYGQLEGCGIPVMKPSLFLGSSPRSHAIVQHLVDIDRFKKYGPIWSLYEGRVPTVMIADPELVRLIFVKDFDYFHNRKEADFGVDVLNEVLDYLPGEKWKTLRSILSPIFTTSKLKSQAGVVANVCNEFINDLKQEVSQVAGNDGRLKFDARLRISTFLIDMFARSTLGIQMENSKDPYNRFATSMRQMVGEDMEFGFMSTLSQVFPIFVPLAPTFNDTPVKYIDSTIRNILKSRRQTGLKKASDFVDFLNELWARLDDDDFKRLKITETTIIAQCINFFLGGYETTTTTLCHLLYYLATRTDVQRRVQEELDEVYSRHGSFDINSISDDHVPYTLACINEALRLSPSLFRPERICTKDWHHNGLTIRKGTIVMLATWAMHRNPKYYENPEEFNPERFLPETKSSLHPYAFGTFGHGPRNCIGMRFAYYSLKLFTANLLRTFNVERRLNSEFEYKTGSSLLVAFKPLYFDLVPRQA